MKRLVITVFTMLGLASCATVPPPNTASGKPEFTLNNVNADCVRSEISNKLVNGGFNIKTMSNYSIVAERQTKNGLATLLLSTPMSGPPDERVTITFLPQTNQQSLRVIWDAAYVSNPGTGFEKIQPIGSSQADENNLMQIKPKLEAACPAG